MKRIGTGIWARIFIAMIAPLSMVAHARADLFDLIDRVVRLGKASTLAVVVVAVLVGLCFVVYGLVLMKKKSDDRGGDISIAKIALCIGAGCFLIILTFTVAMVTETFGAGASDIGKDIF
jgi:hypothetical protein